MNREDFPILKNDIIYFDNGATTLKPKCVIDKITDYYENYSANAHRGDYDISFKVDMEYEKSRDLVKNFINAKYNEESELEKIRQMLNGFPKGERIEMIESIKKMVQSKQKNIKDEIESQGDER